MNKNIVIVALIFFLFVLGGYTVLKGNQTDQFLTTNNVTNQAMDTSQTNGTKSQPVFHVVTSIGKHIAIDIPDTLTVTSNQNNVVIIGETNFNGTSMIGEYNNIPYMRVLFFENQLPSAQICDFLYQVVGPDSASFGKMTTVNNYTACDLGNYAYVVSSPDGRSVAGFVLPTPNIMLSGTPHDYTKLIPYFRQVVNSVNFN